MILGMHVYSQQIPTTNDCKDKKIERLRKQCICKDIEKYANTHYDVQRVAMFGKQGVNKIYTRFRITNGQISDIQVKGSSYTLEQEAIRTLQSFTGITTIPGQISEADNTYTVLIKFEIQKELTDL